jgi:hypothetical protein
MHNDNIQGPLFLNCHFLNTQKVASINANVTVAAGHEH